MSNACYPPSHLPDSDSISLVSQSSISTTATAPNLVGAGRTVGLVYDKAGSWLQRRINWWATRRGYGPHETAKAIRLILDGAEEEIEYHWTTLRLYRPLADDEKKAAEKKCKVLLKYAR